MNERNRSKERSEKLSVSRESFTLYLSAKSLRGDLSLGELSPYELQSLLRPSSLKLYEVKRQVEQRDLPLNDLSGRRYVLQGRYHRSHREIHLLMKGLGLIKVSSHMALSADDLLFIGLGASDESLDQESRSALPSAWRVDHQETERILFHLEALQETADTLFERHFQWLIDAYQRMPLRPLKLTPCLPLASENNHSSLDFDVRVKITVLTARENRAEKAVTRVFKDPQQRYEMRWSPCFSSWSQLVLVLWRGSDQNTSTPFQLDADDLYPILADNLYRAHPVSFLLITPLRKKSRVRSKRYAEQMRRWVQLTGRALDWLELPREEFNRLEQQRPPHEHTLEQVLSISSALDDPPHEAASLELRPCQQRRLPLNALPISAELLPWLGLIPREAVKATSVEIDELWWLAQPLCPTMLADLFGIDLTPLMSALNEYAELDHSTSQDHHPLLLTEQQAIILCDLINVSLGLTPVYLTNGSLDALIQGDFTSPLHLKRSQRGVPAFRLPSLIERESLCRSTWNEEVLTISAQETLSSGKRSRGWSAQPWGIEVWRDLSEWTHDDPYHWGISAEKGLKQSALQQSALQQSSLSDPYWASILAPHQSLELSEIKLYTWSRDLDRQARDAVRRGSRRAALRLLYAP